MSIKDSQIMMAEIPIVRFQIENINFGIDVYQIRDIIRLDDITRVPNCPDYIMGVINLRGQIIPVVNLRKRLSFDVTEYKEDGRVLIVEFGDEISGLVVDSVSEVMLLSSHNIEPRPRYLVNNIDANYLVGLGLNETGQNFEESSFSANKAHGDSDFILLLDIAKVLNLVAKQKEESIIKRIVERKATMLNEEREKIRAEILKMKDLQKDDILSTLQAKLTTQTNSKSTKIDDTFKERQMEIIEKIRQSQDSTLNINFNSKSEQPKISMDLSPKVAVSSNVEALKINTTDSKVDVQPKKRKVKRVIVRKKTDTPQITLETPKEVPLGKLVLPDAQYDNITTKRDTTFEDLDEMQRSLIQEIGNIGAGNAATALSTMIDKRVDISVPRVDVVPTEFLSEKLGGSDQLTIAIYLGVEGDVSMYMMLVFKKSSALRLSDQLLFQERPEEELETNEPLGQMDESALMEIANILGSHYLTALSEFTGLHMIPSPPSLAYDMLGSVIDFIQIELEEKVDTALILNTDIIVEKKKIEGYILILPIPESITSMLSEMGL
ncbi:hypothetical protein NEF87_000979 [Candidatus Lokiarchaeum ossiferum]|uniref:CheW-like domain-containing protein n=1 Tax=Candidatus Lokiarchaeum ossiferum TaxID=2951803 RepID=A0ABY6HMF5_9ARCH|nr:hypothetical protein NEF87_000979 [Candidatus Lokiarchaeum sp. B-35]